MKVDALRRNCRWADLAILVAIVAAVFVLVKLRERRDLVIGSIVFVVLLTLEAFLGGLIGDSAGVAAVHFPLAMGLMALSVWLPLRSRT